MKSQGNEGKEKESNNTLPLIFCILCLIDDEGMRGKNRCRGILELDGGGVGKQN